MECKDSILCASLSLSWEARSPGRTPCQAVSSSAMLLPLSSRVCSWEQEMSISETYYCPLPGDPGRLWQDGACLTNAIYFLSLLPTPLPVAPGVTAKCKVAVSGSLPWGSRQEAPPTTLLSM